MTYSTTIDPDKTFDFEAKTTNGNYKFVGWYMEDGTKITSAATNTTAQADVVRTARISFAPEGESTKIYEVEQRGAASNQTNAFWNISENSDANKICSLEANTPKQITVRVWIEGEDPLCVDAVQQAGFSVQLKFEGDKIAN